MTAPLEDPRVRFFADQIVALITVDLSTAERTAMLADLHDMAADAPPGVRALLAAAMAMVVQLDEKGTSEDMTAADLPEPFCTCECGCRRTSYTECIHDVQIEPLLCMACLYGCAP